MPSQSLKELLFMAFARPDEFQKNYTFPKNIDVKPSERGVFTEGLAQVLTFNMRIGSGPGATKFVNEIRGYELGDGYN